MTVWLERTFNVKLSKHTMMCRLAFPFSTRNTPPSATGFSPYRACKAFLRHDIKFSSPIRQLAFTSKTWNIILLFVSVRLNLSIIIMKGLSNYDKISFFSIFLQNYECRNIDNFFFQDNCYFSWLSVWTQKISHQRELRFVNGFQNTPSIL